MKGHMRGKLGPGATHEGAHKSEICRRRQKMKGHMGGKFRPSEAHEGAIALRRSRDRRPFAMHFGNPLEQRRGGSQFVVELEQDAHLLQNVELPTARLARERLVGAEY